MSPDTTLNTAAYVAAHTSTKLKRTNTLFSQGYDDDVESCLTDPETSFTDKVSTTIHHKRKDDSSLGWIPFTDKYMNKRLPL